MQYKGHMADRMVPPGYPGTEVCRYLINLKLLWILRRGVRVHICSGITFEDLPAPVPDEPLTRSNDLHMNFSCATQVMVSTTTSDHSL